MQIRRRWAAIFGLTLLFPAPALWSQQAQSPSGELVEPWKLGAIGVGKGLDGKASRTTAAKGLRITIGEEGEAAMAYDLELCRILGGWTGQTPAAIEEAAFTTGEIAGFMVGPKVPSTGSRSATRTNRAADKRASGEGAVPTPPGAEQPWRDPRKGPSGPLPPGQAQFGGFCVNRNQTILRWNIGGTEILELPAYDVVLNGGGFFTRTFLVAPASQAIRILVAGSPQPDGPVNFPTHKKTEGEVAGLEDKERVMQSTPWVHGDRGEVMIWAAGDPDGSMWRLVNGQLALEVPPRAKPATFQVAYWTAPKNDPDGHTAPLFFREPDVDLTALTRGVQWRTISASDTPPTVVSGAK